MGEFITDGQPWENPDQAANEGYAQTPASFGSFLGASAASGPVGLLTRQSQQGAAEVATQLRAQTPEGERMRQLLNAAPIGADNSQAAPQPSAPPVPMLSPEEVKKQYGVDVSQPTSQAVAQVLGKQKADEIERDSTIARFQDAHSWPTNFAAGSVGFMLDPLNAASAFVPGVGEETMAAGLGRVGLGEGALRTGLARVGAGATGGLLGQAPLTAVHLAIDPDYGVRDAFRDMMFGAAAGALFHAGFGYAGDAFKARFGRPAEANIGPAPEVSEAVPESARAEANQIGNADAATKAQAMQGAVAQMAEGREVDVAPVFDANGNGGAIGPGGVDPSLVEAYNQKTASPQEVVAEAAQKQADMYRNGYAQGIPQSEFNEVNEGIYGAANKAGTSEANGTEAGGEVKHGTEQQAESGKTKTEENPEEAAQVAANDRAFIESLVYNELGEVERQQTSHFVSEPDKQGSLALEQPTAPVKPAKPPQSLLAFLKARGGVKDAGGELKARDLRTRYPGLINKKGMDLDRAREAAIEAGYPIGAYDHASRMELSTVDDLLRSIDNHPVYRMEDEAQAEASRTQAPEAHIQHVMEDDLVHGGMDAKDIDPDVMREAIKDVVENKANWQDAYERAIIREAAADSRVREALKEDGHEFDLPGDWAARAPDADEPAGDNAATAGPVGGIERTGQAEPGSDNTGNTATEVQPNGEGAANGGQEAPKLSPEMQAFKDRLEQLGPLSAADMAEIQNALRAVADSDAAAEAYDQAATCLIEAGI